MAFKSRRKAFLRGLLAFFAFLLGGVGLIAVGYRENPIPPVVPTLLGVAVVGSIYIRVRRRRPETIAAVFASVLLFLYTLMAWAAWYK